MLEARTIAAAERTSSLGRWGKGWGNTRPPALPVTARHTAASTGDTLVGDWCLDMELPRGLTSTIVELEQGESGHRAGQPALNFNARLVALYPAARAERLRHVPDAHGPRRAPTRKLITAWGRFQFNRDAWRITLRQLGITPARPLPFPWECTPVEEMRIPLMQYQRLWAQLDGMGLGDAQRGALIRLWHAMPARYKRVRLALLKGQPFDRLWVRHTPADRRRIIAAHIDAAGLGIV